MEVSAQFRKSNKKTTSELMLIIEERQWELVNGEFPDKFQKCSTSTSTAAADVRRSIDIGKDLP